MRDKTNHKPYEYHRPISRRKHRDDKNIDDNTVQYIFFVLFPNRRKRTFMKFSLTSSLLKKGFCNVYSVLTSQNTRQEQLVPAMSRHGYYVNL